MNWSNPQLSVGQKCVHQAIGIVCYEATGAALAAFLRVSSQITNLLKTNTPELEKGLPSSPSVAIHVFMIAKINPLLIFSSEDSVRRQTRPTIAIISKSKEYRKRARILVKRDMLFNQLPGFDIVGFDRVPAVERAGEGHPTIVPGMSLLFPTGKAATLECFRSVNGMEYGMTAFHASIEQREGVGEPQQQETVSSIDDDNTSDSGDDYEFEFEARVRDSEHVYIGEQAESSCSSNLLSSSEIARKESTGRSLAIDAGIASCSSASLDYLIFPISLLTHDYRETTTLVEAKNASYPGRVPCGIAREPPNEQEVWAKTSTTGTVHGNILNSPYFIKLPGASTFEEMWAVRLDRKTLPGDCGAWIMDKKTNQLYGHIVAGDPQSYLAYIIPSHKVFDDMKGRFGIEPDFAFAETEASLSTTQDDSSETRSIERNAADRACIRPINYYNLGLGAQPIRNSGSRSHSETYESRREEVLSLLDNAPFDGRVIAVAAAAFFVDAYYRLASNLIMPIVFFLYSNNEVSGTFRTLLACSWLVGAFIGQICFSIAADRYGRRKMYGLELVITINAAIGLAMSTNNYDGSDILAWVIFWRLVLGIGSGAEYPLSAVICAEYAPLKKRLPMLSSLFYLREYFQLFVILVAGMLARNHGQWISADLTFVWETQKSRVDSIWRVIIAVGTLPALVALVFRILIPETPRYTLDVVDDSKKALRDIRTHLSSWTISRNPAFCLPKISMTGKGEEAVREQVSCQTHSYGSSAALVAAHDKREHFRVQTEKLPQASFDDARDYFLVNGNWRYILATSLSWFFLDFAFYGLGMNTPLIATQIRNTSLSRLKASHLHLTGNTLALVVVLFGAIIGGCIIVTLHRCVKFWPRRKTYLWGFVIFALVMNGGIALVRKVPGGYSAFVSLWFLLVLIFFNLGPNASTFIMPAEIFPTRYRASCNGIAAASGTLGCIVAQLFFTNVRFDGKGWEDPDPNLTWLSPVLMILCIFLTAGSVVTWYWIPETRDERLQSKTLEELAVGYRTTWRKGLKC